MNEKPHYIEDLTEEIKTLSGKLDKHVEESHIHIHDFKNHLGDDDRNFGELKDNDKEMMEKINIIIPSLYERNLELTQGSHNEIMEKLDDLEQQFEPLKGLAQTLKAFGLIREPAEGLMKGLKFWVPLLMFFGFMTFLGWIFINKLWSWLIVFLPTK